MPEGIGYGVTQTPTYQSSSTTSPKKASEAPKPEPVQREEPLATAEEPPPEETEFLGSNVDFSA